MGRFFPAWSVCLAAITVAAAEQSWYADALAARLAAIAAAGAAEPQAMDLPALAKKARPAVVFLLAYDASGKKIATGTGFLVSSDGRLITNHHVIAGAHKMVAKAENGGQFPIEGILATDAANDLALLKLDGKDLAFLRLGSSRVEPGIRVAVIGSPLGLEGTLSEGIVSAVREFAGREPWLQISAAISPGSSGSPVLNANGEVIGIATFVLTDGQSLNFAVSGVDALALLARARNNPQPFASHTIAAEDAIFSDPDYRAALAAEAKEDSATALKHAQSLVKKYADNYLAHYALGVAYGKLNFTADAITAYQQALKLEPDYAKAWYNLGVAYRDAGRATEAKAAFQKARELDPSLFK